MIIYGIRVADILSINEDAAKKIVLECADFAENFDQYVKVQPDCSYSDWVFHYHAAGYSCFGVPAFLCDWIRKSEELDVNYVKDFYTGAEYVGIVQSFPWLYRFPKTLKMTEAACRDLFSAYVRKITSDSVTIGQFLAH